MNQFKKAKQKALESGHHIENVADLKTAGVKTVEPINSSAAFTSSNVKSQESTKSESTVKIPEEMTTENLEVENNPTEKEILNTSNNIEVSINKIETSTVISSSPDNLDSQATTLEEPVIEKTIVEEPVVKETVLEEVLPLPEVHSPVPDKIVEKTLPANDVIHNSVNVLPTPTEPTVTPIIQEQQPTVVVQQQTPVVEMESPQSVKYIEVQPQPAVSVTKSNKKSVPNIFAPKGEAKSMRKSLVLKPTSVKIAENYCAKNGGSFNELIQTLLDNFIDEYGL